MVQEMVDFSPRLTGWQAHQSFVTYLETTLSDLGPEVTRDPYPLMLWASGNLVHRRHNSSKFPPKTAPKDRLLRLRLALASVALGSSSRVEDVGDGLSADVIELIGEVCFTPQSGDQRLGRRGPLSANSEQPATRVDYVRGEEISHRKLLKEP